MVREVYNDNKLPAGKYKFFVKEVSERVPTTNNHYRSWKLATVVEGETKEVYQNLFPWAAIPLLVALGYDQDKRGNVSWDTDEVIGKQFEAQLFYQKDKDDPSKEYPRLGSFARVEQSEEIPF